MAFPLQSSRFVLFSRCLENVELVLMIILAGLIAKILRKIETGKKIIKIANH